ncbi:RNase H domain-containing protein [Trichonephila clavipes]|nr:RNase H domain-containing protein [Trichonephila clavipes]
MCLTQESKVPGSIPAGVDGSLDAKDIQVFYSERNLLYYKLFLKTISYKAVFTISGSPPIDIFIIGNNEFKITTKNYVNKSLDSSLRVSELPHPSERFPLNLVNYRKNIENKFPVVCFTDGSKINTKVGLAFVILQDFIEIETRQFRIRDECSVFQAELLCIAEAVSWIFNNEILSLNFLICSDSLSSLHALNNINSPNKLIVKTHVNLNFLRSRGVQVFFSFVRGHTGIYGNERADWLAKEATKLCDQVPMSIQKSFHKKIFKEKIIFEWNNLYQISNNAHFTKEFIPSIQSRLKAKHFHANFKLTQFLTGHGNFKAYLKRFNLSPTDQCSCSSDTIQNAKHLILACTKFSSERRTLMNCLQKNNIVWPPPFSAFVEGKSCFTSFCAYINSIFS